MEGGGWKVEDGGWRVEGGGWKVEGGGMEGEEIYRGSEFTSYIIPCFHLGGQNGQLSIDLCIVCETCGAI